MYNRNKNIPFIRKLLTHGNLSTKIEIYMGVQSAGDDFDSYEENYTYSNLNPLTIKGYVSQLAPTSLVWRNYGLKEQGAVEIICDQKYQAWFEKSTKIKIDSDEYQVFREGTGGRSIITKRPSRLIRIILQRK